MIARVILILALQTIFLGGMVAKKQYTHNTGTQILLETQPIDPRSLFRGDYVILNYTISTLDLNQLEGDNEFREHDDIYVKLRKGELYHEPIAVYHEHPGAESGEVVIKGEVNYISDQRWDQATEQYAKVLEAGIEYGIENYFVPEGEGRELERRTEGKVDIRVAVDQAGNSGIKAILVDGEERYIETLF